MTVDDATTQAISPAHILRASNARLRPLARRALWRVAPTYAQRRAARAGQQGRLARVEAELEHVSERHDEQLERLEQLARELILTAESLRRAVGDVEAVGLATRRRLELVCEQLDAAPYLAGNPFELLNTPVGEALGYRSAAALRVHESLYADFEEVFRGPSSRVTDSQRPYVALVRDHQPILDLGCGRGEFLALLAAEGISASGVDSDAGMVAHCAALGLPVEQGDASAHLQGLEDGSLGAVFSAQLIEHLSHTELMRVLEFARRKLRARGLFIAETVNPHRIASLKTFWVDPTHRHPIFPETALVLSALAGFGSAYVFAPEFDSFQRARLQAPSYALVARVPADRPQGEPAL